MALVENLMTDNEDLILKTVHERNIKEIIWTGHSLAGGKMHSLIMYIIPLYETM
jgi:hypothetical protein